MTQHAALHIRTLETGDPSVSGVNINGDGQAAEFTSARHHATDLLLQLQPLLFKSLDLNKKGPRSANGIKKQTESSPGEEC